MKTLSISESIANGTDNQNLLDGKRIRMIPNSVRRARVRIYEAGSAAGLFTSVFVGDSNPKESGPVGTQNRTPIIPDDLVAEFTVGGGQEITYNVSNNSGGALTINALVVVG